MTGAPLEPVIAAALRLAGEKGWRRVGVRDIAEASGVSSETLRRAYPCKTSILLAYAKEVERRAAAAPTPFDPDDTVRDRLFELLMQRLDILEEHRGPVTNVLRDMPFDPLGAAASAPELLRLMGTVLEQAGVPAGGPAGWLRRKGLAAIWLATLYVWSGDDSPDHARTMAALDGNLRRAEPAARLLVRPFSLPGGF